MDPRERKHVLGQWGVRDENDRERLERVALELQLEGSPVRGKPLRARVRNFRPDAGSYVASLGGPLPYMQRLRQIEDETRAAERELERAWHELADECGDDGAAFARRWRRRAERWSFVAVNELIEAHNRWYPTEARLPMDVRTRDYVLVNGEPYWREPLGPAWALARFPPVLAAAR